MVQALSVCFLGTAHLPFTCLFLCARADSLLEVLAGSRDPVLPTQKREPRVLLAGEQTCGQPGVLGGLNILKSEVQRKDHIFWPS